jgi:hypothetical protein
VFDFGFDPNTTETMTLERLFTYADMAIDRAKARQSQSGRGK